MSGRYALIIGNTEYTDPGLAQLTAPGKDVEDFAYVLKDQAICAFDDVKTLLNQPEPVIRETIDEFFDQKKPDDLLVLYFSGHGIRDELGALYLAVKNTNRYRLRSTAVKSDFIRETMDQSRSRRQVLILDCCNSGAFAQGTKAATGMSIGTASAFEAGYGRVILTASDSTQFAWEGDKVIGGTDNSLFTHFLVQGLQGEADLNGDGCITVDELYDYAYERVKLATPKQTPSKFSSKQQGEIVLRQIVCAGDLKPISLPVPLLDAIQNPISDIRLGAVQQLTRLLYGRNPGLARSAQIELEKLAAEDDSRRVSQAATQVLTVIRRREEQTEEERWAEDKAERLVAPKAEKAPMVDQKVEEKRLALEKAAEKRLPQEKPEAQRRITRPTTIPENAEALKPIPGWFALVWITLGWVIIVIKPIAGPIFGPILRLFGETEMSLVIIRAITGAFGGLITSITLRGVRVLSRWKSMLWITLGWSIDWTVVESIGMSLGWSLLIRGAVFGIIGGLITSMILRSEHVIFRWKRLLWITLGWAIGWTVAGLIGELSAEPVYTPIFGSIGGAVGGFVMIWQIRRERLINPRDQS